MPAGKYIRVGSTCCYQCKTEWTSENRYRSGTQSKSAYCKDCEKKRAREYAIKNPDRKKASNKKHSDSPQGRFTQYRYGAEKRNISFDLTLDEFMQFWNKDCSYCGDKISTIGIDRIDSTKGYTSLNITSCCFECNEVKWDRTQKEMFDHMLRTLRFQGLV